MGLGDIESNERGSGARYNDGKIPYELISWSPMALALDIRPTREEPLGVPHKSHVRWALVLLGEFQSGGGVDSLAGVLHQVSHAAGMSMPELYAETARVLEYGKNKYSKRGDCTCSAGNAIRELEREAGFAEAIERRRFSKETVNMQSANGKTKESGTQETQKWSLQNRQSEQSGCGNPLPTPLSSDAKSMGSPSINSISTPREDAQYADHSVVSSSTTATKKESSEECYAIPATLALDLSRGLAAGLREHSPTCGVMEIEHGGDWNWAKGMSWQSVIACAARHLLGTPDVPGMWDDPKGLDPESGLMHAGHVACNVMFLLQFMRSYPEGDDRPKVLVEKPF